MRRAKVVLVAVMTVPLAGCVLSGKPKTVAAGPPPPQPIATAPPPEPLSIPQTHVDLPLPQPLDPDALKPAQTVDPAPQVQAKPSAPPLKPPPRGPATSSKPPDPPPPAAEPEQQPARPQIQEILSADAEKQLRDSARRHQADTRDLLKGVKPKTENQIRTKAEIDQFIKQSMDAEAAGDMRKADQLAERAFVLAKELQSGK